MNKLRQSFRRKKDVYIPEASRPHQWQTDEEGVRTGKCSFPVKVKDHVSINVCVEKNGQFIICEVPHKTNIFIFCFSDRFNKTG